MHVPITVTHPKSFDTGDLTRARNLTAFAVSMIRRRNVAVRGVLPAVALASAEEAGAPGRLGIFPPTGGRAP